MDECRTDAGVAMTTEKCVGVAMSERTLTVLVDMVIPTAMGMEGGGMVEDIGHTVKREKLHFVFVVLLNGTWATTTTCKLSLVLSNFLKISHCAALNVAVAFITATCFSNKAIKSSNVLY